MENVMPAPDAEVMNDDEAGIMLLSVGPEKLLIMLSLATRTVRTSALALDAERLCHMGQASTGMQRIVAEGRQAWATLVEQPAFERLRLERRNGSPRQTWRRFRGQAEQNFPDARVGQLDVLTAVAIRHSEVNRTALAAQRDLGEHARG